MANTKYYLATWQYAADEAYVLRYYLSGSDSMKIDIWSAQLKKLVSTVTIDDFSSDISAVHIFTINDVCYIVHEDLYPKMVTRYDATDTTADDYDEDHPYVFEVSDMNIKIDPVLTEYSNRNTFEIEATGTIEEGDSFYVYENELTDMMVENGAELLFTDSASWRAGQMLMLKRSTDMSETWAWCYEDNDTDSDSSGTACCVCATPTPSETYVDEDGGITTCSETEWMFAYGTCTVETAGKWSGRALIQLWTPEMDTDDDGEPTNPDTLAVLEVNNAMANRSVTRDIPDVGSRIRIKWEERSRAQSVNVTTDNDCKTKYLTVDNDTGCYITVSCATEQAVYVRIVNVTAPDSTADDTRGKALCTAIHPFEGGFTSVSFAEGAWCASKYGYPRVGGVFQERMVFGGNKVKPCTLWCSKTDDWTNFVQGSASTSPIFATANTDNIDAIQWMIIAKSYIMFGSLSGEWYFGSSDGSALKPSNYSFQRLSNFGSTEGVSAVMFGSRTITAKNGGKQIVDVSYNTLSETGEGTDLSLFAAHLFETDTAADLAATMSPKSLLFVLMKSGRLLSFTYEQNNNVFAWARHEILDGVLAMTVFRRDETDYLAMLVQDGDDVMLAELEPFRAETYDEEDADETIFQDETADGTFENYTSRIIPTPIQVMDGVTYGSRCAFKSLDIYLKPHSGDFDGTVWAEGTEFSVTLGESGKTYMCDNGWLASNEKQCFGENRVELPLTSGWHDLALVDISTDYPAPLTITAIGADISIGK